jgi:hypothetical protein
LGVIFLNSLLAQASRAPVSKPTDQAQIIILVGSLIAAVAVMTVFLLWVRRRFLASQRDSGQQAGLLEQLRQMKLAGQITQAEFESAKARLGAKMREAALPSRLTPRRGPEQGPRVRPVRPQGPGNLGGGPGGGAGGPSVASPNTSSEPTSRPPAGQGPNPG